MLNALCRFLQYFPAEVGLTRPAARWLCSRCVVASAPGALDTADVPMPAATTPSAKQQRFPYSKTEAGLYTYEPVPDFGPGWCQARKFKGQGLKNVFLSPLGYELRSREEATRHMNDFEKKVDDNLLISRENEFKEYLSQVKPKRGQRQKGRHKRQSVASPGRSVESAGCLLI